MKRLLTAILGILTLSACSDIPATVVLETAPDPVPYQIANDVNGDGITSPDEVFYEFPVYNGDSELTFVWNPITVPGIPQEKLAYRIALYQVDGTDPDFSLDQTVSERKVAYHMAVDGERFTIGAIGFGEPACFECISFIGIVPAEVISTTDPVTGQTRTDYRVIEDDSLVQISEAFLLKTAR